MKQSGLLLIILLLCSIGNAQEKAGQSSTDLAKAAQNPIADLISLPLQWNSYFETGPKGKTQNTLKDWRRLSLKQRVCRQETNG